MNDVRQPTKTRLVLEMLGICILMLPAAYLLLIPFVLVLGIFYAGDNGTEGIITFAIIGGFIYIGLCMSVNAGRYKKFKSLKNGL